MAERDDPEVIGRRVQQLRIERGLTQKQLAEPAYTPAYISTLEAGRVRASDDGAAAHRRAARRRVRGAGDRAARPPRHRPAAAAHRRPAHPRHRRGRGGRRAVRRRCSRRRTRTGWSPSRRRRCSGSASAPWRPGNWTAAREYFERAERRLGRRAAARAGCPPCAAGPSPTTSPVNSVTPSTCSSPPSTSSTASGLHDPDALLLLYASVIGPYMDMGAHARAAQAAELALALAPQVRRPGAGRPDAPVGRPHDARRGPASPRPTPPSPRPPSSTGSCRSVPNWPTATGCAATCTPRTANWSARRPS